MQIKLLCPISRKEIKKPVIYQGYIYDKESIEVLIEKDKNIKIEDVKVDLFTLAIIDYLSENNTTLINLEELDDLYRCPLSFSFPQRAVLCLSDGRTYEKNDIIKDIHYRLDSQPNRPITSYINFKPIKSQDLIYHPLHVFLFQKLSHTRKKKQSTFDLKNFFIDFKQKEPILVDITRKDYSNVFSTLVLEIFFFMPKIGVLNPLNKSLPFIPKTILYILDVASQTYISQKTYKRLLVSVFENISNNTLLKAYTEYKDANGNVKQLSNVKKGILATFFITAWLLPYVSNLKLALAIYNHAINFDDNNYRAIKSYPSNIAEDILYRPLAQTYITSILIKNENLPKKIMQYLVELVDEKAIRNFGKSSLKIRIEAVTTLLLMGILIPTTLGGLYAVSESEFFYDASTPFALLNLILNFPLAIHTTVTTVDIIRTALFSRGDKSNSPPYGMTVMEKIACGASWAARAINAVSIGNLFQFKGSFFATGIGINKFTSASLDNCVEENEANRNEKIFKRLGYS